MLRDQDSAEVCVWQLFFNFFFSILAPFFLLGEVKDSAYDAVKYEIGLILFHPSHYRLFSFRLHGCVDEQSWFARFFLQNLQCFVVVGIFVD